MPLKLLLQYINSTGLGPQRSMLLSSEPDLGDAWLTLTSSCLMVITFKLSPTSITWGFELDAVEIVESQTKYDPK